MSSWLVELEKNASCVFMLIEPNLSEHLLSVHPRSADYPHLRRGEVTKGGTFDDSLNALSTDDFHHRCRLKKKFTQVWVFEKYRCVPSVF